MISIISVVFPECLFPTARHVASGASVEGSHGRIDIEVMNEFVLEVENVFLSFFSTQGHVSRLNPAAKKKILSFF
jgi:hypothetical protein